ncbi:hypothetical protein L596_002500 [Steinernema carpocapsae]|uniref:EF-hand domain-containing protein n=1 Tax=Steinernema carpocapsae TaxID=34508 RepID=A0A4U8UTD3_STECR|nr:hypothetical protein L596_002500 [Steinernema carpocapsae]
MAIDSFRKCAQESTKNKTTIAQKEFRGSESSNAIGAYQRLKMRMAGERYFPVMRILRPARPNRFNKKSSPSPSSCRVFWLSSATILPNKGFAFSHYNKTIEEWFARLGKNKDNDITQNEFLEWDKTMIVYEQNNVEHADTERTELCSERSLARKQVC